MGTLDFSPSSVSDSPQAPTGRPSGTPANFDTITTIKNTLNNYSGNSRYLLSARQRLESIDEDIFKQIDNANVEQYLDNLNQILSQGGGIDDNEARLIHDYVAQLMLVYQRFFNDINRNTRDTQRAYNEVIPVNYLDETDISPFANIEDKVRATEDMDTDDIIPLIRAIEINSPDITKKDWNDLFADFRNGLPINERPDFDRFITEFKQTSELYKNGLNIESISSILNSNLSRIESNGENDPIDIVIEGETFSFETKKGALQFIYKMKLILSELDKVDLSFTAFLGFLLSTGSSILGGALNIVSAGYKQGWVLGTIFAVLIIYTGAQSIESIRRNITDFAAINFGKNTPNPNSLFYSTEKPTGKLRFISWRNRLYNFMKHAHDMHHDILPESVHVTVFDGFENANDKQEDIRTKQKAVRFYEQKYANDPERLAQLKRLRDGFGGFTGGQQASATRTFWMRLYAIDRGLGITGQSIQTMHIKNYKLTILGEINDALSDSRKALAVLFPSIPKSIEGDLTITDLEKTLNNLDKSNFYTHMLAYVDLDGTLSNTEESVRNTYIKELVTKIASLDVYMNDKELKQEFMRIADGKVPKYKTLEIISERINASSGGEKRRYNDFLQKVQSGDWIGTKVELDTALDDIRNNSFSYTSKIKVYTQVELNTLLEKGEKLHGKRYELPSRIADDIDFINEFKMDIELAVMVDSDLITEDIHDEFRKLYKDIKGGKGKVSIDYTEGHLFSIIHRLLQGEKYANVQSPFTTQADFDKINTEYESRSKIGKELRRTVFMNIGSELDRIEAIPISENERKIREFEKFKKQYGPIFKAEGDLKNLIQSEPNYDRMKSRFIALQHEVGAFLKRYIEITESNGRRVVNGEAKNFLDTALKMDPTKKDVLQALRERITSPGSDRITLVQLENVIREVLVGNISKEQIKILDFGIYINESSLSDAAREIRIIPERNIDIRNIRGVSEEMRIQYTDDSRFIEAVRSWNEFINGREKIRELQRSVLSLEKIQGEISTLSTNIDEKRANIRRANSPVIILNTTPVNIEALQVEVEALEKQKAEKTTELHSLQERINSIDTASGLKSLSSIELLGELHRSEVEFIQKISRNPGFQDYASRNSIDPSRLSGEDLWKGFMEFFQSNTVKTGGSLNPEVITRISELGSTPRVETPIPTDTPERATELSPEQRTELMGELNDFIDGLKKVARLDSAHPENLTFLNAAKRKIRTGIENGSFTAFSDILKLEINGRGLDMSLILGDERFNDFPNIEAIRNLEGAERERINLRSIWRHLRLKI